VSRQPTGCRAPYPVMCRRRAAGACSCDERRAEAWQSRLWASLSIWRSCHRARAGRWCVASLTTQQDGVVCSFWERHACAPLELVLIFITSLRPFVTRAATRQCSALLLQGNDATAEAMAGCPATFQLLHG